MYRFLSLTRNFAVCAVVGSLLACTVSKSLTNNPDSISQKQTSLLPEPSDFKSAFPAAPGMKLKFENSNSTDRGFQQELTFHGVTSLDELEEFYRRALQVFGEVERRREDNFVSLRVVEVSSGKLITLMMFDHALIPTYPTLVYERTNHPSMQYRSVSASYFKKR